MVYLSNFALFPRLTQDQACRCKMKVILPLVATLAALVQVSYAVPLLKSRALVPAVEALPLLPIVLTKEELDTIKQIEASPLTEDFKKFVIKIITSGVSRKDIILPKMPSLPIVGQMFGGGSLF